MLETILASTAAWFAELPNTAPLIGVTVLFQAFFLLAATSVRRRLIARLGEQLSAAQRALDTVKATLARENSLRARSEGGDSADHTDEVKNTLKKIDRELEALRKEAKQANRKADWYFLIAVVLGVVGLILGLMALFPGK